MAVKLKLSWKLHFYFVELYISYFFNFFIVIGLGLTTCTAFSMETFYCEYHWFEWSGEILSLTFKYCIPLLLNQGSSRAVGCGEMIPPLGRRADNGYNSSLDA